MHQKDIINNNVDHVKSHKSFLLSPVFSIPNIITRLFPLPYHRLTGLDLAAYFESLEILSLFSLNELENTNPQGFRPLHYACVAGATETALYLLEAGANPNKSPPHQGTPLFFAAYSGNCEIIESLFEHGAVLNENEQSFLYEFSPINVAIKRHNFDAVYSLLRKIELHSTKGYSPLMMAISMKFYSLVQPLLSLGIDPCIQTSAGISALYLACSQHNIDIVRLLLQYIPYTGYSFNGPNSTKPLHWAVCSGSFDIVKIIYEYFPNDLNALDSHKYTPIFYVTSFTNFKMMEKCLKFLIEKGAFPMEQKRSLFNDTLYNFLNDLVIIPDIPLSIIRLVLESNASPIIDGSIGMNAIELASSMNRQDIVDECKKWAIYPSMIL